MEKKEEEPCHGIVVERNIEGKKTYTLECHGKCDEGKCSKRTKKDHHGTVTEWCSCDDGPGGCNIYIETKADGSQRIDCFTLGCDEGYECKLVEHSRFESDGETVIKWVCACVKIKG